MSTQRALLVICIQVIDHAFRMKVMLCRYRTIGDPNMFSLFIRQSANTTSFQDKLRVELFIVLGHPEGILLIPTSSILCNLFIKFKCMIFS